VVVGHVVATVDALHRCKTSSTIRGIAEREWFEGHCIHFSVLSRNFPPFSTIRFVKEAVCWSESSFRRAEGTFCQAKSILARLA
jgi:hypothetical protein